MPLRSTLHNFRALFFSVALGTSQYLYNVASAHVKHLLDMVYDTAGNVTESLNDERMLRPIDRRGYHAAEQHGLKSISSVPASVDMPPGLQQLLGKPTLVLIAVSSCGNLVQ